VEVRVEVIANGVDRLVDASVTPMVRGPLHRMITRANYAQDVLPLSVQDDVGRFRVLVPDRMDVSLERLADAIRALSSVRRRFPWAAVRTASFDDASALTRKEVSGSVIEFRLLEIHVARGLIMASTDEASGDGFGDRPAETSSWLVQVLVHECWHLVESVFETTRYRDSLEFRKALGNLIGVATLEHAYGAGSHATREEQRAALDRLRQAVGEYATTAPREGTAELFTASWLGLSHDPVVVAFGELVYRFLPAHPVG
jgi:hypothetical protein